MARRVSWALCVAVVCSRGLSQAGRDVVLRFLDSQTGFAITPDTVLLNGARAELKPAGSAGAFTLGLVSPPARLDVAKRGYAPLRADVDASAASRPAELVLDPLEPPREFSRGFLKEFLRDDLALVVGFVSDDTTGQALPGVEVLFTHASEKVAPTQTQANGSFVLSVPWKIAERKGTDDPTILSFNKIGYQTLERQYVQLYPAHAAKYRIRLTKGGGARPSMSASFGRDLTDPSRGRTSTRYPLRPRLHALFSCSQAFASARTARAAGARAQHGRLR